MIYRLARDAALCTKWYDSRRMHITTMGRPWNESEKRMRTHTCALFLGYPPCSHPHSRLDSGPSARRVWHYCNMPDRVRHPVPC